MDSSKKKQRISWRRDMPVDHMDSVIVNIASQINNEETSDITISVGKQEFYLHKLMLSRSDVFKVMMYSPHWTEDKKAVLQLEEMDECLPYMSIFFEYFYTGLVELTMKNCLPLLILANKYCIKELENSCENFMSSLLLMGPPIGQVIDWWSLSEQLNLQQLSKICKDYILINMDDVISSEQFMEFSLERLKTLLNERDMVVKNEFALFNAMIRWMDDLSNSKRVSELLPELLPYVKFHMISAPQLMEVESRFENCDEEIKSKVQKCLLDAYKFHAVPFHKRPELGLSKFENSRFYSDRATTIRLTSIDRSYTGLVLHPVSCSSSDSHAECKWDLKFRRSDNGVNALQLQITGASDIVRHIGHTDMSILIYNQASNDQMFIGNTIHYTHKFSSFKDSNTDTKSHHSFKIPLLPLDAFHEESPYLIQEGSQKNIIIKLIMRYTQIQP